MQSLGILLVLLFGTGFIVQIVFWLLFFFVVKVRIADKGLVVDEGPKFSFLWRRWPHEEMRAYRRDLSSKKRRRWINLFLCNVNFLGLLIMGPFVLILLFRMVAHG